MSLAGLLTIVDDDPQLHDAIARAEAASVTGPGSVPGPGAAALPRYLAVRLAL